MRGGENGSRRDADGHQRISDSPARQREAPASLASEALTSEALASEALTSEALTSEALTSEDSPVRQREASLPHRRGGGIADRKKIHCESVNHCFGFHVSSE